MGMLSLRFLRFSVFAVLAVPLVTPAAAPADRDVRIAFVAGDVRQSLGDGKHPDLAQSWEQAQVGAHVESGFALYTGDGRAEIDFEGSSVIFLAPNSLLLFTELSGSEDRLFTRLTLATGTASFALEPTDPERFEINTPTESFSIAPPETLYARIGAYLDATSITPIHLHGESLVRDGLPTRHFAQGQTFFLRANELIDLSQHPGAFAAADALFPAQPAPVPAVASFVPDSSSSFSAWDSWVAARRFARAVTLTAALNASGLHQPVPGLADLYQHGTFFSCEPFGTCWEPNQPPDSGEPEEAAFISSAHAGVAGLPRIASAVYSPAAFSSTFSPQLKTAAFRQQLPQNGAAQAPQSNSTFQPQTVQWEEYWQDDCGSLQSTRVSRVAHSPAELQELLRRQQSASRSRRSLGSSYDPGSCYAGFWIHHHNHYARVITPPAQPGRPRHCMGAKCAPVHPPRPLWVRVGNKVGIVPRHPNDSPGKPPLNLKNGVLLPPARPGESLQRVAWNPSLEFKILPHAPAQFAHPIFLREAALAAPVIHAHLLAESIRPTPPLGHPLESRITYNYKTREFTIPSKDSKNGQSREVAIGSLHANGRMSSFADGRSHSYASGFYSHSAAAASYNSGRSSYAMNGGSSSGGSRASGGVATSGSGSRSSGGSGGFSGGGAASHSSGGGASASAGGGGSGGGRPH